MPDTFNAPIVAGRTGLDGVDGYPHSWPGAFPHHPLERNQVGSAAVTAAAFAAALAELALTMRHVGTHGEHFALAVIADSAVAVIGGAEQAAVIGPAGPGRSTTRSARADLIPLLVDVGDELGQGPLLDAEQQGTAIVVDDLDSETRWPLFTARALTLGVRSVLCTPLAADGAVYGSLALISTRPAVFTGESATWAAVFAAHAALALTDIRLVRNLTAMVQSRDDIGQAKGILMERHKISADDAFDLLVAASQHGNIKLHQVCRQLVDTGELPAQR